MRKIEQKLQCGVEKVGAPVVEPAAPITRHRRDVDANDAPSLTTVAVVSTDAASSTPVTTLELETSTPVVVETTSVAPPSSTPAPTTATTERSAATSQTSTEAASKLATSTTVIVETTSLAPTTTSTTPPPSARMNVEIIAHIYDTSTDGAAISRVVTVEEARTEEQQTTTAEHGQEEVSKFYFKVTKICFHFPDIGFLFNFRIRIRNKSRKFI